MSTNSPIAGESGLRPAFLRNLVLLVLLTSGAIGGVFLFGAYHAVDDLSRRTLDSSALQVETELTGFFEPVQNNLSVVKSWGEVGQLDVNNWQELNRQLIPILAANDQICSMLFADTKGREYLLLRDGDTWVNRLTARNERANRSLWKRSNSKGELIQEWEKELDYDSKTRPWYQAAIANPGQASWTQPYTFFTTKSPGITASTTFVNASDNQTYVVAFDVLLIDVSNLTTAMQVADSGYVSVLTEDGKVLGLPRHETFNTLEAKKSHTLKPAGDYPELAMDAALAQWNGNTTNDPFRFSFQNTQWWSEIRAFRLGETDLAIAVVVPNSDFLKPINRQRNSVVLITLLALMLAVGIGGYEARHFRKRMRRALESAQKLGQYTIEEHIGSGGMGNVYRASHAMLRRPTALKLLKPELADHGGIERFEREVQLTCRLTHPNTVIIFDYGHTPDGVFYYAMELLDGLTLLQLINIAGPLPAGRMLFLLEQICASLEEAHKIGLIHRDIKPGNIIICKRGGNPDTVKVLDFGLVKDVQTEGDLTSKASTHGTPGYMAPETMSDLDFANPATDIYAVGSVAYAIITGKAAYEGSSAIAVLMKQVEEDPPPPSSVLGVPVDVEKLIGDFMSRDLNHRVSTMEEALRRIRECRDYGTWSREAAIHWWAENDSKIRAAKELPSHVTDSALTVDIACRGVPTKLYQ